MTMKTVLIAGFSLGIALCASARPPNYDEAKVAPYSLEDPLSFADGTKLVSRDQWPARRAEILGIFAREMYGRQPPEPETVLAELIEQGETLGGLGIRRQYRMWFKADKSGPHVDWIVFLPNRIQSDTVRKENGVVVCENDGKVPVIIGLNYRGNQELVFDPEVVYPANVWVRNSAANLCTNNCPDFVRLQGRRRKGAGVSQFPVEMILARGYAVMSACYAQVSPDVAVTWGDDENLAYTGIFSLWPKRDENAADNITALGAWAWALSRGLDLAERIREIDAGRSVVSGCSRLAKAALLAAARDERFAVCVPNQTGGGGCPLSKRDFGENVSTEMKTFPHWFCKAYAKYIDNEQAMAFDQHLLIASIAPRAILVEGFNTPWYDTRGEFLACRAASPVWEFLGAGGLPKVDFPDNFSTAAIGVRLGYVRRGGGHGLSGYDWNWMLDFADSVFAAGRCRN